MTAVHSTYIPTPEEIGLGIPRNLIEDRFREGFHHALTGGQLNRVEQLRLSFREGYRSGKLYLKEVRRRQGIIEFPVMGKVRMRVGR